MKERGIGIGGEVEIMPEQSNHGEPQKVAAVLVTGRTPMDLLSIALSHSAGIDVIERLAALQRDTLAREAETDFNEAMNRVQEKIKRIAPDLENTQKNSKYASYAAIDRAIRPIYSAEGFSLSFTHADCPKPDFIRVICRCAHGAHKELYQVDWPVDTKGPQGSAVMTATQATGASDSYAKRYLVKDIFNIAIGQDDDDGNLTIGNVPDWLTLIREAKTIAELKEQYGKAVADALLPDKAPKESGKAIEFYKEASKKRKAELLTKSDKDGPL